MSHRCEEGRAMEIVITASLSIVGIVVVFLGIQLLSWAVMVVQSGLLFSTAFIFLVIGALVLTLAASYV